LKLIHYDRSKIQINENTYSFDDFLKLEPNYSVPWGFHTRVYERGVKHYVTDGSNTLYLKLVDPYCDAICQREGELARLVLRLKSESEN
jgi:hypothetical protein